MPCGCALAFFAWLPLSGTAPATLTFEEVEWRNESWGFHAVHGHRHSGLVAVSRDGSRLNRLEGNSYRFYFWTEQRRKVTLVHRAPDNAYYTKWEQAEWQREACACSWLPRVSDPQSGCAKAARNWLTLNPEPAGEGRVAGQRVVRWKVGDTEEVALAPDQGCEVMELVSTTFGRFGIPASRYHCLVTSYKPGEPDPALLQAPQ